MTTVNYCGRCGAQRQAGARFCAASGAEYDAAAPPAPPPDPVAPPAPVPLVGPAPAAAGRSTSGRFLLGVFGLILLAAAVLQVMNRGGGTTAGNQPAHAAPTPAAAVAFEPVRLSGQGSKVPKFSIPDGAPAIATFAYRGSDNFIVHSLADDGSENGYLVNVIGTYDGTVLFDENDGVHSVAFQIEATGPWTALIEPLTSAPVWGGSTAYAGEGDKVIRLNPSSSGLTTMRFAYRGDRNFIVHGYSDSGRDGLVNEVGNYSGDVLLPAGTFLITVEAEGTWSVTPQ